MKRVIDKLILFFSILFWYGCGPTDRYLISKSLNAGASVDSIFEFYPELLRGTRVDLSGLGLTTLPAELSNNQKIKELNLSKNKLDQIDVNFAIWPELILLDLSSNPLTQVPKGMQALSDLKSLNLSFTSIQKLLKESVPGSLEVLNIYDVFLLNRAQWDTFSGQLNENFVLREQLPNYLMNKAAFYQNNGLFEMAKRVYSELLQYANKDWRAYENRAICLHQLGMIEDAANDYDRALSLNAQAERSLINRGIIHYNSGETTLACDKFKRAADLGSKTGTQNYNQLCGES